MKPKGFVKTATGSGDGVMSERSFHVNRGQRAYISAKYAETPLPSNESPMSSKWLLCILYIKKFILTLKHTI